MAAGDISKELSDRLAVRLEDSTEVDFDPEIRYKALSEAQRQLGLLLNNAYLSELQAIEYNISVSLQKIDFDDVDSDGIYKGNEGIIGVDVKIGDESTYKGAIEQDVTQRRRNINRYSSGTDKRPTYYIYAQQIFIQVETYTDLLANVFYLQHPTDMSDSVDPVLNESLHGIILDLAEGFCWSQDGKADRRATAMENAMIVIKTLNERYTQPTGAGKSRR